MFATFALTILAIASAALVFKNAHTLRIWIKTLPRDVRGALYYIQILAVCFFLSLLRRTVVDIFRWQARKYPYKLALSSEKSRLTFAELDALSNRVARVAHAHGLGKGDVIALFMESSPEYVALWLGFAKAGVVSALINHNLRGPSLCHSITVAKARAVVYGRELYSAVDEVAPLIESTQPLYFAYGAADKGVGDAEGDYDLDGLIAKASSCAVPRVAGNMDDVLLYIYTSGTTGLPKAAVIRHGRYFHMCYSMRVMAGIAPDDIVYCSLPLYHSAGVVLGIGQCLLGGTGVHVRSKFSASRFWDECAAHKCTVIQYIGDICRFLLATPPTNGEKSHRVRLAVGNGMRPDMWTPFVERFNVREVREFYGSTEGNANLVNIDNRRGAVGFNSVILPWVYPVRLVRYDQESGTLIRDARGMCMRTSVGEPGELVGRIGTSSLRKYDGYVGQASGVDGVAKESSKIARDVAWKGDVYFRTGDILWQDEEGYLFFADRVGDTFRWKGENVATSEVEQAIRSVLGHDYSACVYGVEIPGCPGRAGMATVSAEGADGATTTPSRLDVDSREACERLARELCAKLPSLLPAYARPLFLRFTASQEMTGTFKVKKTQMQKEGYDPATVPSGECVCLIDYAANSVTPVTPGVVDKIASGAIRV
eukprot:Opistho-2@28795